MSITDVQIAKSEWLLSSWVAATQVSEIKEKLISRECVYTMTMQIPEKKNPVKMSEEQRYSCAGTDMSASLGPQAVIETNNCLRGSFSLRCDSVETQLVYANLLVLLNTAL